MLFERDGTSIVSLPGVPGELEAIVDESLGDLFDEVFGTAHYEERSLIVDPLVDASTGQVLSGDR